MTADPNGSLGVEAALSTALPTGVMEIFPVVLEQGVRNDLFEGRVIFGFTAIHEEVVCWIKNGLKVSVDISFDSLKSSQFVKELT